jgi:RimJ/RimL family protein N-acetyltransferase
MIKLVPMTPEEFRAFREWYAPQYAQDHVRIGTWEPSEAVSLAKGRIDQLLPGGLTTPDHALRTIVDEATGERVGEVWFGFQRAGARLSGYIHWIGVFEAHRGRGIATAALRLVEAEARNSGASRLALNVFASNTSAATLYAKLGFGPAATFRVKQI